MPRIGGFFYAASMQVYELYIHWNIIYSQYDLNLNIHMHPLYCVCFVDRYDNTRPMTIIREQCSPVHRPKAEVIPAVVSFGIEYGRVNAPSHALHLLLELGPMERTIQRSRSFQVASTSMYISSYNAIRQPYMLSIIVLSYPTE
jgi:hypothetical protein